MIIDVHTHGNYPLEENTFRIINIRAGVEDTACTYPFSYGLHPYDVETANIETVLSETERLNPVAIGEIGLDYRFQNTAAKQCQVFRKQIEKAADLSKPVIIHAVRALPQVLSMVKDKGINFVIHGFRGTMLQAEMIAHCGGFLSVSPYMPKQIDDIFKDLSDYILLETDETGLDIREQYKNIADRCLVSMEKLEETVETNYKRWITR